MKKQRKIPLVEGKCYHIYSKSIAGFKIFRDHSEFNRIVSTINYYLTVKPCLKFSAFLKIKQKETFSEKHLSGKEKLVKIVAYCIMPTHIHLILKQLTEGGISTYINNILNSYTRYFNIRTKRKGPLWESRFQNTLIDNDDLLLHMTRYLHLNPVTAYLIDKPDEWEFSSYNEFMGTKKENSICDFSEILDIKPKEYKKFVNDQIDYQRELAKIKHLTLE